MLHYRKESQTFTFEELTVPELLECYTLVLRELKKRDVIRTKNLVGDYAEWLVAARLGLKLLTNSNAGCDGVDDEGIRYQIKGRQPTPENPSTELGAIHNLGREDFDYLIGVLLHADFTPRLAVKVPYGVVVQYARYKASQNGHVLYLQGAWLKDPRVQDITGLLFFIEE